MWVEKMRVLDKVGHFEAGDWLEAAQGQIGLVPSHGLHKLNLVSGHLNLAATIPDKAVHVRREKRGSSIWMEKTSR